MFNDQPYNYFLTHLNLVLMMMSLRARFYLTYLFRVYLFSADSDFYQSATFDNNFEKVSTARGHYLVRNNGLERVAITDRHRDRP